MANLRDPGRRSLLKSSLIAGGLSAGGLLSIDAFAQGKARINMQLGWIPGVNQIGEVTAKRLGFYEQEGIDFAIQPGGPNIDGVAIVASGRYEVGQVSSSPSVMLAVSQGLPIKCFAVGAQKHPFTFFSLPKNPVRKPADLVGKKVGIPSTAAILLRALLAKNKIRREGRHRRHRRLRHGAAADRPGRRRHRLAHQHDRAQGAWPGPRRYDAVGCRRAALCAALLRVDQDPRDAAQGDRCLPARHGARLAAREGPSRRGSRPAGQGVPQSQARGRARRGRRHARVRPRRRGADAGLGRRWIPRSGSRRSRCIRSWASSLRARRRWTTSSGSTRSSRRPAFA